MIAISKTKWVFFLIIFVSSSFIYAQDDTRVEVFISQSNCKIPIYTSPLCDNESYSIFQDSIFEHFYWVEIIGESVLAFEVKIGSASQYNSPIISGWIEKKYCGVFLKSNRETKLFDNPNTNSSYKQIVLKDDIMAIVIDAYLDGNGFIKVLFREGNVYYEGWTINYCGNIYNSCN